MSERKPFADKFPSQPGSQYSREVGIVLLNHVGSNSRQDTGRDAQFLADRFGVMAIAVDRPTSHGWPRDVEFAQRLRNRAPVKEMFTLAAQVDRVLDTWQVKRAIIVSRSAGGLGALELAQTEGISGTTLVYAAEPVGCYYTSDEGGKKRYVE